MWLIFQSVREVLTGITQNISRKYSNYLKVVATNHNNDIRTELKCEIPAHYYNSNLIWSTVSRLVDEVIPLGHSRRGNYFGL